MYLGCQGGNDALGVDQRWRSQVVQAIPVQHMAQSCGKQVRHAVQQCHWLDASMHACLDHATRWKSVYACRIVAITT